MLYRPHFCCHCGEKIIRAKWTPLTSRRFCDFCAVEKKQHDLLPRAAAVLMLILGAAGITSYLGGGKAASNEVISPSSSSEELKKTPKKPTNVSVVTNSDPSPPVSNTTSAASNTKQLPLRADSSTEAVYYCGALTKKGTACTRRVKSPGRCWQHLGQPSDSDVRK
jgi:hypothetical protein